MGHEIDRASKHAFPSNRPNGITIHATADRDMVATRQTLDQKGLGYHIIITRDGMITQHAKLTHGVWHAGKALWRGYSPNQRFLAVSLISWGVLNDAGPNRYQTWAGKDFPRDQVAIRPSNTNGRLYGWDGATSEQYAALVRFCLWAIRLGVPVDNICGHDECALPLGRKTDPGGVLPVTMIEFRKHLLQKARELKVV